MTRLGDEHRAEIREVMEDPDAEHMTTEERADAWVKLMLMGVVPEDEFAAYVAGYDRGHHGHHHSPEDYAWLRKHFDAWKARMDVFGKGH